MTRFVFRIVSLLICAIVLLTAATASEKTLDIDPVYQQTSDWCWLAVGEMVLRNFDEPNVNPVGDYQCGIIGLFEGPGSICSYNCSACAIPAGSADNISRMLRGYPPAAASVLHKGPASSIRLQQHSYALSYNDVKSEIDQDRPIIAGVNPLQGPVSNGEAQHVVLIIGYDDSDQSLIVNDPFPYEAFGAHPYQQLGGDLLEPGQYEIDFDSFKQGLRWSVTFDHIVDPN